MTKGDRVVNRTLKFQPCREQNRENLTQAVSGGVAQVAVIVGTAVLILNHLFQRKYLQGRVLTQVQLSKAQSTKWVRRMGAPTAGPEPQEQNLAVDGW